MKFLCGPAAVKLNESHVTTGIPGRVRGELSQNTPVGMTRVTVDDRSGWLSFGQRTLSSTRREFFYDKKAEVSTEEIDLE